MHWHLTPSLAQWSINFKSRVHSYQKGNIFIVGGPLTTVAHFDSQWPVRPPRIEAMSPFRLICTLFISDGSINFGTRTTV